MSESLDLNIENYDLNDLLKLFKLSPTFGVNELKQAKKQVMLTHPDKSKLPKEYFIFFVKAYKYLHYIYDFKCRYNTCETDYEVLTDDSSTNKTIIEKACKQQNFNEWFNKMFNEYTLEKEDDGYETWLKSEQENTFHVENASQLHSSFNKFKEKHVTTLVKKEEITDTYNSLSSGGSDICNRSKQDYTCGDVFSKSLQYNDVKKAHTESFIPVTERDFSERRKYNSVFELNHDRETQQFNIPSMEQSRQFIKSKENREQEIANENAYRLLQQHEQQEALNKKFWKNMNLLK